MAQDSSSITDPIKNAIKNTFIQPLSNVENAVSKYIPNWLPGVKSASGSQDTSWHDSKVAEASKSFQDAQAKENANKNKTNTPAKPKPTPAPKPVPKFHDGTDYVTKTGKAELEKGEAVLNKEDAAKYREGKQKMATKKAYDVSDELAGKKEEKPAKEIHHVRTRKAKSGGYVHTHVHTHPEHYPEEEHVSQDQDGMVEHMLQHLGEPNPGEAEAEAGQSGIPEGAGAAGVPPTTGVPPTMGA